MKRTTFPGSFLPPLAPLLLLFWSGGCSTTPDAPIPPGKPVLVEFFQPPRRSQPRPLHLRLVNRSWVKGPRPQVPSTKICADEKMERLLQGLTQEGFFRAASQGRPGGEGWAYLAVEGPGRAWVLDRPRPLGPQGRLPGEDFRKAFTRFQRCTALFLALYNVTFDLVPRKVKNGRDFFLQERKRILEQQKKILQGKKGQGSQGSSGGGM